MTAKRRSRQVHQRQVHQARLALEDVRLRLEQERLDRLGTAVLYPDLLYQGISIYFATASFAAFPGIICDSLVILTVCTSDLPYISGAYISEAVVGGTINVPSFTTRAL